MNKADHLRSIWAASGDPKLFRIQRSDPNAADIEGWAVKYPEATIYHRKGDGAVIVWSDRSSEQADSVESAQKTVLNKKAHHLRSIWSSTNRYKELVDRYYELLFRPGPDSESAMRAVVEGFTALRESGWHPRDADATLDSDGAWPPEGRELRWLKEIGVWEDLLDFVKWEARALKEDNRAIDRMRPARGESVEQIRIEIKRMRRRRMPLDKIRAELLRWYPRQEVDAAFNESRQPQKIALRAMNFTTILKKMNIIFGARLDTEEQIKAAVRTASEFIFNYANKGQDEDPAWQAYSKLWAKFQASYFEWAHDSPNPNSNLQAQEVLRTIRSLLHSAK